jgi:hypothetical protein
MKSVPIAPRPKARFVAGLTAGVGVMGALAVAAALLVSAIGHLNPFATTKRQKPNSVVLDQIHDLARFDAATGHFQTVIDQSETSKVLPTWAYGQDVTMVAEGDIDASVDFSSLPKGAIAMSADGQHADVTLPAPTLGRPHLDPSETRVIGRERGVLNRVGDALGGGDPVHQDELEQVASSKLSAAASQSDLQQRAESNARSFVEQTLHSAGVKDVTVTFTTNPA